MDLDGTLADSLPALRRSYDVFLKSHGKTGSDTEFSRLNGPILKVIVDELIKRHGLEGTRDELISRYLDILQDTYGRWSRPRNGAERFLSSAVNSGIKLILVTSAPRYIAVDFLTNHSLDHFFDAIIAAENVSSGKPSPEPYQKALAACRVASAQAMAFEDSPAGVRSAIGAGVITYGIAPAELHSRLLEAGATAVFADFDDALKKLGKEWDFTA